MAFGAAATETIFPTTVIDIDKVLAGEGVLEIDLNSDEVTDFLIEILSPPVLFPAIATAEAPVDLPEADFTLPVLEGGQQALEIALIRSVSQSGGVLVEPIKSESTQFALTFADGDVIGGMMQRTFDTSTALLYYDTVDFNDPQQTVRSFGPFSEAGDNAFIGLSIETSEEGTNEVSRNFGFLEITRGSITVGRQGFQEEPFVGAQIGEATTAVPLPAPLAFLAAALLGLFGLRRRA